MTSLQLAVHLFVFGFAPCTPDYGYCPAPVASYTEALVKGGQDEDRTDWSTPGSSSSPPSDPPSDPPARCE